MNVLRQPLRDDDEFERDASRDRLPIKQANEIVSGPEFRGSRALLLGGLAAAALTASLLAMGHFVLALVIVVGTGAVATLRAWANWIFDNIPEA
jgi:hypothetical protein